MSARDGGPAFPCQSVTTQHGVLLGDMGMTLRDYFAAKALHGLLHAETSADYSNEHIAVIAYMLADAMLKAREAAP